MRTPVFQRVSGKERIRTGDIDQEQEGNLALAAQLDEVCGFERAGREEDAVVRDDANGVAMNVGEALPVANAGGI